MPYLEAQRGHAALTDVQKEMVQEKHVVGDTTFLDLFEILRAVAEFDYTRDAASSKTGCWAAVLVIGGIGSAFVVGPAALVFLLPGLFLWKKAHSLGTQDLHNLLRDFVVPSMQVLRQDLEKDAPVTIDLDLRGGTREERQVGIESVTDPGMWQYPKIREKRFVDPWLKLSTVLADGSRLVIEGTDHIRQRTVTRRRRKVKTKTKYKIKRHIIVRLGVKRKHYQVGGGLTHTEKGARDMIRVKSVTIHTGLDQTIGPDVFVGLMSQVYGQLGPARQEG